MNHTFLITVLLAFSSTGFSQNTNIHNIDEVQPTTTALPTYDTTTYFLNLRKLIENPQYYDNQKVLFLPTAEKANSRKYYYVGGFTVQEEKYYPEYPDTTWIRVRKRVKDGDYVVSIPKSNIYQATKVRNVNVRFFDNLESPLHLSGICNYTGFCTPISNIEGHSFIINSVSVSNKGRSEKGFNYHFLFDLADENGKEVTWQFTYNKPLGSDLYMPLMLYSKYERTLKEYVGKTFIQRTSNEPKGANNQNTAANNSFAYLPLGESRYRLLSGFVTCNEMRYLPGESSELATIISGYGLLYLEPMLVFKDEHGAEFALSPNPQTSWKTTKHVHKENLEPGYTSTHNLIPRLSLHDIIDIDEYNAQKEEERLAAERIIAEQEQQVENEKRRIANQQAKAEQAKAERKERLVKKYGSAIANDILKGYVRIGWNKEKCREAWGKPKDINRTITADRVVEQWVYGDGNYLYFENEILTTIQNY